jgi:hypothetical protein
MLGYCFLFCVRCAKRASLVIVGLVDLSKLQLEQYIDDVDDCLLLRVSVKCARNQTTRNCQREGILLIEGAAVPAPVESSTFISLQRE